MADGAILIAAITAPHGLDGAVRLKVFSDNVAGLKCYRQFATERGTLTLKSLRPQGDMAIARFAEIPDRTAAEQWRGTRLTLSRSDLPAVADDEIYHADLVGMHAVTEAGTPIGIITDIPNYGAGDLLDIRRDSGASVLVPLRPVAVQAIDSAARRVTIAAAFVE